MASQYKTYGGNVQDVRIYVSASQISQSYSGNYSTVQMKLYMYRASSNGWTIYQNNSTSGWWNIDGGGQNTRSVASYSYSPGVGVYHYLDGGTNVNVGHDGNGYKTMTYQGYHNPSNSPYLEPATTPTGSLTLSRIPKAPAVTTNAVSSITAYTALFSGNVTDNKGATVTSRGFVYGTSSNPTGNKTTIGSGNGTFTNTFTGLSDNTLYYVRAWATNSQGTTYGANQSFTTLLGIQYGEIHVTGLSSATIGYETDQRGVIDALGTSSGYVIYLKQLEEAPPKTFVYKVYDKDGNFRGVWDDVSNDLEYNIAINTLGSQITVRLARSADRLIEIRDVITTEIPTDLLTEDGEELISLITIPKSVGEGTDVDINLYVDVYVFYGDFENLLVENGQPYITQDGEEYLIGTGNPNGAPIFTGYITDYTALYGQKKGVNVTLRGHGTELSNLIHQESDGDTHVKYLNTDPSDIIRDVLDKSAGKIFYTTDSIQDTGLSEDYDFRVNTSYEVIKQALKLSTQDWYYYISQATNELTFKMRSSEPDIYFTLGKDISDLKLVRSGSQLLNQIYYIGGVPEGGTEKLFRKYDDTQSQTDWRVGMKVMSDSRVTVDASADAITSYEIGRYKDPVYTTTVEVLAEVFQIEDIRPGQMVGFRGFGNFIDDLSLQVMEMKYTPYSAILSLQELTPSLNRAIKALQEGQQTTDSESTPAVPTDV